MGPSSHIKHARYSNKWGNRSHSKPAPGYTTASIKAESASKAAAAHRAAKSVPAAWER